MTTSTDTIRETIETVLERLSALRSTWLTREDDARRDARSRKMKTEAKEAEVRLAGAADIAAAVVNGLVPSANYTPYGIQSRFGQLAALEGLQPIFWFSTPAERAAHLAAHDRTVRRFADEILSR